MLNGWIVADLAWSPATGGCSASTSEATRPALFLPVASLGKEMMSGMMMDAFFSAGRFIEGVRNSAAWYDSPRSTRQQGIRCHESYLKKKIIIIIIIIIIDVA